MPFKAVNSFWSLDVVALKHLLDCWSTRASSDMRLAGNYNFRILIKIAQGQE